MSEALRLAHELILAMRDTDAEHWDTLEEAAAELRRLHALNAEPRPIQECYGDCPTDPATCLNPCNFEGRPKPEQKPQTTHWEGCEAVHPECKTKHGVKDLSNYEFKTYKTGGAELEAGFYSTDELRDLVKALDKMNAATERSMRKMK